MVQIQMSSVGQRLPLKHLFLLSHHQFAKPARVIQSVYLQNPDSAVHSIPNTVQPNFLLQDEHLLFQEESKIQ